MASKLCATTALLLAVNLLLFTVSSATYCPPPTKKPPPKKPPPVKPPPAYPSCPRDTVKLGGCANVLNLLKVKLGAPPKETCCPLLKGLTDVEAAMCLCTVLKASIMGINLNLPVDLSLLLSYCGKSVPSGFKCA